MIRPVLRLVAVFLLLGVVGCRGLPLAAAGSAASGAPVDRATNRVVIWGEVPAPPSCACDHPDYVGRVSRGLAEVHLDQGFAQQNVKGDWQLFTVTFDPRTVPTKQVVQIIEDRGGKVISIAEPTATPPAG